MSRSRQLSPLPDGLPPAARTLLGELRVMKDRSGYDLRALAGKTHASRSSWGRWLSGETWIPREAVVSMAELCGSDPGELGALWQRAEDERRARQLAVPPEAELTGDLTGRAPGDAASARWPDPVGAAGPVSAGAGESVPASAAGPVSAGAGESVPGSAVGSVPATPAGRVARPRSVASAHARPARARRSRAVFAVTVVVTALVAGAAGLLLGLSIRKPAAEPAHGERLTRQDVLARVLLWHPHTAQRIPYSQSGSYLGYRTDGSGYAAMAVGLPAPGPNSGELASAPYTRRISPRELLPGDLVIDPTGGAGARQVAIFDHWADAAHTRYWVYQQRRGYGTDHLILSSPLDARSEYHAYRPLNLRDTGDPAAGRP